MDAKKMTAVEWLQDEINKRIMDNSKYTMTEIFDQAKAMEKEQIIEAVIWFDNTERNPKQIEKEAEYYYKQTYGQ